MLPRPPRRHRDHDGLVIGTGIATLAVCGTLLALYLLVALIWGLGYEAAGNHSAADDRANRDAMLTGFWIFVLPVLVAATLAAVMMINRRTPARWAVPVNVFAMLIVVTPLLILYVRASG